MRSGRRATQLANSSRPGEQMRAGRWPLTLKFNRVTKPFLKINIQDGAYRQRNIIDVTWAILLIQHVTLEHSKIDMDIFLNNDKGHGHFLKSACDLGDPPSRAMSRGAGVRGGSETRADSPPLSAHCLAVQA